MSDIGNSNRIAREYIDTLRIETRYLDSTNPTLDFELYGEKFASPIMTAALSHLDHFMFEGASQALALGAKAAGAVLWYGMAPEEEIERLAGTGVRMIEIIKPYTDRDKLLRKLEHAQRLGLLAVGIDIDHPFGDDGSPDIVDGESMTALTTLELAQICRASKLPVIIKGVLSGHDAQRGMAAGVGGMVLSHHAAWCSPTTTTASNTPCPRWPCCRRSKPSPRARRCSWTAKSRPAWTPSRRWPSARRVSASVGR